MHVGVHITRSEGKTVIVDRPNDFVKIRLFYKQFLLRSF